VPLGRFYAQHGTLSTSPPIDTLQTGTDDQDGPADDYGQPRDALTGRSSNKTIYVSLAVHLARALIRTAMT
jgi:hypothetical protein